ncbi:NB-ARC domain-containing protein [Nocardia sp. NPDC059240]|uniref:NB-ARC domain-containing protein n=1 Tax=Nocardia sp. NPDC059240 TaxID=3346786 RepID=UPI0036CCCA1D
MEALKKQFTTELNAAILRAERQHGRVSRTRLAKNLNISTGSVYAYLNGTTLPGTELLDRLLDELHVDREDAGHLATLRDSVEIAIRSESGRTRDRLPAAASPHLPRDTTLLTGRDDELRLIQQALARDDGDIVCVVSGIGGVGKTALAVRAAHTLRDEFPDGCLFVDLHGYAAEPAMPAAEAADKLLRQLGLPTESIPAQADQRGALLRAHLRGQRLLVVLDNVRDTAHVLPLLPADSRCGILITSRGNLNALDDAVRIRITPLSAQDAVALLEELVVDVPPERLPVRATLENIAAQCHGLPVAVRIAAAVLRSEGWPIPISGDDAAPELGAFHDGDRGIEQIFEYSTARLQTEVCETLALLGLHCGRTFDADAAVALAGADRAVLRHLRQLVESNLLDVPLPGRYAFHDLLRAFAIQLANTTLTTAAVAQARGRIVEHYLARADLADRLLTPHRHRAEMIPAPIPLPHEYGDYDDAEQGLSADRDNLIGAARMAFERGLDEQCWQLAFALRGFAFIANDVDLWVETHELGLRACQRAGNRYAEAVTRNNLGLALLTRGDDVAAAQNYEQARALFVEIGDAHGEHTAIAHRAWVHFHREDFEAALRDSLTALSYVTRFGLPRNVAILLRDTALIEVTMGKCLDAVPRLLEAREMFASFGLYVDEAMTCNVLGTAYRLLGASGQAWEAFEQAIELAVTAHSVLELARGHDGLGEIAAAQQDWPTARAHWQQALEGFTRLHDTARAETIAARLLDLPQP